ncbi:prepilin-type N-terminal cleavage/methylation domain-containing protein [bacterium]|jgi:prepilin-type N-terminal cleavage/methylation domain-containing protein|nr:prepilin-type N-terminal cleavage/methylation domain-containing protein [bacterium]
MNKNQEGFTLIELLFGIAILMILMTVIYGFLHDFSQKSYLVDIQTKATSNLSVLNNTVS